MNKIEISIIMPFYNAEKTIANAIKSVVNQTFNSWELVLVNDGSTDDSEIICRRFMNQDSRVKYIKTINRGVASARNTGLLHAEGK